MKDFNMFSYLKLVPILLLAPIIYYFVEKNTATNDVNTPTLLNQKAPDFSSGSFKLSSVSGKPIIVHFWATWCGPCIIELPSLIAAAKQREKEGFQFIAVAQDKDMAIVDQFIKSRDSLREMNKYLKVILDPQNQIAKLYNTTQFPETFLINSQFIVDNKLVGEQDWLSANSARYLEKLK